MSTEYDAVVVGSGPNGLAAAIAMQMQGLTVLLLEAQSTIGGGMRTQELTLPGFQHDVCAAVHPLFMSSPFFSKLPLEQYGLTFIDPKLALAHPYDNGESAFISSSLPDTAAALGIDRQQYHDLIFPIIRRWERLTDAVLAPLQFRPSVLYTLGKFAAHSLRSAQSIAGAFKTEKAKGLLAGLAAHTMQPLDKRLTGPLGLILAAAAHHNNWPIAKTGSASIARAMGTYFKALGGTIETGIEVKDMSQLPSHQVALFDTSPRQLLQIAGHVFSSGYRRALRRYRYGMGVFKIDWALAAPVPFTENLCKHAGTVHLGNTFAEINSSEQSVAKGLHPDKPFVLFSQPSVFDRTRAPRGKHTAWAYCHVPGASTKDMTTQIENQIERFAPGFRDCILARHTLHAQDMETYNANYVGGDINGGVMDLRQLFARPALRISPYRTSKKGIYICSSSTPPGGGVHGMCGYHAARTALKDIFEIKLT